MLRVTQLSGFGGHAATATAGPITLTAAAASYALTGSAATIVKTIVPATWDPATVTNVTLSGGNLIATNTGTTSADQGARVASGSGKTSGKYYFEVTCTTLTVSAALDQNYGMGIGTTASSYTGMGNNGSTGSEVFHSGNIYSNGSNSGVTLGATPLQGDVIGIAADLDNRKIWFRKSPSGNWNNSGSNDPVSNVGGVTVPSGTMVPFVTFGGTGGSAGQAQTANFGGSAFSGAVPAGFTTGWPV